MRLMRLKTVVLPAPFGPISVNTSPRLTSKLTSSTASTPPKRMPRFLAERIGPCIEVVMRTAGPPQGGMRPHGGQRSGEAASVGASFQPVRFEEAFLPLEHALAVERK